MKFDLMILISTYRKYEFVKLFIDGIVYVQSDICKNKIEWETGSLSELRILIPFSNLGKMHQEWLF